MTDVVMEAYTMAYESSGKMVQAFGVVSTDGSVIWQSNNWDLTADAKNLVNAITNKPASIIQNQVKYSTMRTSPESLVAKNIQGNGILVVCKVNESKWVIAWANGDASPDGIYVDVDRAAKSLRDKV